VAWQQQFVDLLEELQAAYDGQPDVGSEVTTIRHCYVAELIEAEMSLLGITTGDEGSTVYYDKNGHELEPPAVEPGGQRRSHPAPTSPHAGDREPGAPG
jgi:hypothetical protein